VRFQHFVIEKRGRQGKGADLYFLYEVIHMDGEVPPAEAGRGSLFYKEHLETET